MGVSGATTSSAPHTSPSRFADVLLLSSLPPPVRVLACIAFGALALAAGLGVHAAQQHFAAQASAGTPLNPIAATLAQGSTWKTLWPGWVAAAFFGVALMRLRGGPAEPPAGRGDDASMSVAELRAGLRSEYAVVRACGLVVLGLALVDGVRLLAVAMAAGPDHTGAPTLVATALEWLGLACAAGLLFAWITAFHAKLADWGAL